MAEIEIPPYFLCPITLEIMKDPVILSTGITYDRDSIEKWIFCRKNNTCPVTKQTLDQDPPELTPNVTLRRLIQSWCTLHAVERLPTPKAPVGKSQILKLLNDVLKSPQTHLNSLQTLKSISTQNQTNKRLIEAAGAVEFLASFIVKNTRDSCDLPKAIDEALSILYNLDLSESSFKALDNGDFIESLTVVMKFGSYESRAYAVMLLRSVFEAADPSSLIGLKPEFFTELAQILKDQISQKASKATLKVLMSCCPWGRNRVKAGEAGLVCIIVDLLLDSSSDKRSCEMMLMVLDLLCQCAEGRADLLKHGAGLAVVSKKILRVSDVASERGVRILHSVSKFSACPSVLQEMLQVGVVGKLCLIVQVDSRLKMKQTAMEILKLHARVWRNSPCIPKNLISSSP